MRTDTVWQSHDLVDTFLSGVRGGIPFAAEQIQLVLRFLDFTEHSLQHVVDLGCGDGVIAQAILTHYPNVHVTAIDFSEPMLEQAKARLQPFADRVQWRQADLLNSDWRIDLKPCDAIVSGYCIHHLPDDRKRSLYQEIHQQLVPKGSFLNIEHVASASPAIERLFNEVLIDSLHTWNQSIQGNLSRDEVAQKFVHRDDKEANILASVETQCTWLKDIGFQDVDCYFKIFELAVFGGRKP